MELLTSLVLCVCFLAHGCQSSGIAAFPYEPEPPEDCHPYNTMVGRFQPWVLDVFYRQVLKGGKLNSLIHGFSASQISDRMALTLASNLKDVIESKKNGIIYNVYIRPASSKSEADLQKVEYKPLKGDNKLMLLYTEEPICGGNVCLPKLNKRYEWDQCFVVGKQELPRDQQLNKTGHYLTCYIYYKAKKGSSEPWSNYQYKTGDIPFPGIKDLGSCVVNLGSPVMCASVNKPDYYLQAGIVDKRNVDYMQKTCQIDEEQEDNVRDECKRNNLEKVATYCKKPQNTLIKYCYGFTAFYINSSVIKTATKDPSPKSWKPMCGRRAVKAKYNEFPWIIAIFNNALKGEYLRDKFLCAASLIHPNMAISSKQCLDRAGSYYNNYIISGIRSLDDVNEYNEIDERDRRRKLSGWDAVVGSEFSILFWNEKLNVDPIPLRTPTQSLTKCRTLGWGYFREDHVVLYQATLKKAEMTIHDDIECLNRFKYDYGDTELYHIQEYICAGGDHSTDVCIADQGGPLICHMEDGSAALAGVLEYTRGCPYGLGTDFALNEVYAPNLYLNIIDNWHVIKKKIEKIEYIIG